MFEIDRFSKLRDLACKKLTVFFNFFGLILLDLF